MRRSGNATAGEQLKRINMLAEIDLMLGEKEDLAGRFSEYLSILRSNDLNNMVLVGGLSRIDIAMRWNQFDAADRLLQQWLEAVPSVQDRPQSWPSPRCRCARGSCGLSPDSWRRH